MCKVCVLPVSLQRMPCSSQKSWLMKFLVGPLSIRTSAFFPPSVPLKRSRFPCCRRILFISLVAVKLQLPAPSLIFHASCITIPPIFHFRWKLVCYGAYLFYQFDDSRTEAAPTVSWRVWSSQNQLQVNRIINQTRHVCTIVFSWLLNVL